MTKGLHKNSLRKGEPNKWIIEDIIEKLRAEVERLKKIDGVCRNNNETADVYYSRGAKFVCDNLLSFLSDLEKSNSKDFPTTDEEMKQFLATHPKVELPERYKTPDWMFEKSEKPSEGFDGEFSKFSNDVDAEHPFPICVDEFKDFARHFYELGRQSKPKVSDGLEEEIYNYANTIAKGTPLFEIIPQTARHFAKWGAERLKK